MIDLTKNYQTLEGEEIVLISDQGPGEFNIVGYLKNHVAVVQWNKEGECIIGKCGWQLVEKKKAFECKKWINYFLHIESGHILMFVYQTEKAALADTGNINNVLAVKRIVTAEPLFRTFEI